MSLGVCLVDVLKQMSEGVPNTEHIFFHHITHTQTGIKYVIHIYNMRKE